MFSGEVVMQNFDKEGRESDNKILGYFFFRNKNVHHSYKKDNAPNFLPFLWKYILFDLRAELMEILMNQMLPGVLVFLSVRYFRLTTVTLC